MRWLLAGLSFALLVGLAVATAATRAANVRARARLYQIEQLVVDHAVDGARRRHLMHGVRKPEALQERWRACVLARLQ